MAVADSSRSFHTVTDPEQARLLTDGKIQAYFRPFLARDATASEAAAEIRVDLNAVLYRVKTFLAAGLLRVVREVPRHGRPIKVYRSVHEAYFIPYEVTPFATLEERLWQQLSLEARQRAKLQAKRMSESGWSGQRLYRNDLGETWSDSARSPDSGLNWLAQDRPAYIDFWTDVKLTGVEAREIQQQLFELLKRVEGRGAGPELAGPEVAAPAELTGTLSGYRLSVALLPLDE